MYDIIIAGAGPAGLTAAIYARRANKSVLVIEARSYGGQIINTPDIENYPAAAHISGFDFATNIYNQARELGAEVKFERVTGIRDGEEKTVVTNKNNYKCRSLIIATGSENRKLGLENEDALVGRGVSYCATCDGNFFKNKTVAVAGGGNTALDDALYLADICEKVYLIHRRDEFRGEVSTVDKLRLKANVEFVFNSNVTKLICGERLEGIEVTNNKTGEKRELAVSGLFVAVGRIPENRGFAELIKLDDAGYIVAGEDCRTNVPGIFAAGDNRVKSVRQLVTAASDGAVAATEAVKYCSES